MSDRNWEKEYNEMLAACLERKIIAEKNVELARLRKIEAAARELTEQMQAVYDNPQYMEVWIFWQSHRGNYRGPQWVKEFEKLAAALKESE